MTILHRQRLNATLLALLLATLDAHAGVLHDVLEFAASQ